MGLMGQQELPEPCRTLRARKMNNPPPPRRFWILFVLAIAAAILSGVAVSFVLSVRPSPPGFPVLFSKTFVVGLDSSCGGPGGQSYCSRIEFSVPGSAGTLHVTYARVALNQSCFNGCGWTVSSGPFANNSYSFGDIVNRSQIGSGVLVAGPAWFQVSEVRSCASGASGLYCTPPPFQVSVEVDDLGTLSYPA